VQIELFSHISKRRRPWRGNSIWKVEPLRPCTHSLGQNRPPLHRPDVSFSRVRTWSAFSVGWRPGLRETGLAFDFQRWPLRGRSPIRPSHARLSAGFSKAPSSKPPPLKRIPVSRTGHPATPLASFGGPTNGWSADARRSFRQLQTCRRTHLPRQRATSRHRTPSAHRGVSCSFVNELPAGDAEVPSD
jgi:hypothetical protein